MRRRSAALTTSLAALLCAAPAPASAAGEPTIATAGIDNADHLYVAWRMEAGTTFRFLEFATVVISSPYVRGAFASRPPDRPEPNVVATACAPPTKGCAFPPLLTLFRSPRPVARDRRYFVKVNGTRAGRGPLTSAAWVIDAGKPLRPGTGVAAATPTNKPVVGEPYKPPNPRTIPSPKLRVPSPPKTIAAVVRDGVRADVDCPEYSCFAVIQLRLGRTVLVASDATARPDRREAFVLKPTQRRRGLLQRRTRAQLEVRTEIYSPGGKVTRSSKRFRVRR